MLTLINRREFAGFTPNLKGINMDAIFAMASNQPWFSTLSFIVITANSITMFLSDKFMQGNPILAKVNMGLNFLSMNVFKNKNQ